VRCAADVRCAEANANEDGRAEYGLSPSEDRGDEIRRRRSARLRLADVTRLRRGPTARNWRHLSAAARCSAIQANDLLLAHLPARYRRRVRSGAGRYQPAAGTRPRHSEAASPARRRLRKPLDVHGRQFWLPASRGSRISYTSDLIDARTAV